MTAAEWVSLLVDRASDLRAAGVLSLSFGDCSVQLAPPDQPAVAIPAPQPVDDLTNPMDDPATFGGVLPGYSIPASLPGAIE